MINEINNKESNLNQENEMNESEEKKSEEIEEKAEMSKLKEKILELETELYFAKMQIKSYQNLVGNLRTAVANITQNEEIIVDLKRTAVKRQKIKQ
jgi:hypothetical protein